MTQRTFPKADNDQERIDVLHELKILDTSAEGVFDEITALTASIFDIPTAIISLVDSQRQWFKSRQCLAAQQTDRDVAFCNYTIMNTEVFEVDNPQTDTRFADNPLVTDELGLRYYAGAPITVRGFNIGALCMLDYKKREGLSEREKEMLKTLARIVARTINDHRLIRESAALVSELMMDVK